MYVQKRLAAGLLSTVLAVGATIGAAAVPASASTAALHCPPEGYWEDHITAWYSHCANTCIWIKTRDANQVEGWKKIPGYGQYDIGGAADVEFAWYDHLC